jgi:hypothetical protein
VEVIIGVAAFCSASISITVKERIFPSAAASSTLAQQHHLNVGAAQPEVSTAAPFSIVALPLCYI